MFPLFVYAGQMFVKCNQRLFHTRRAGLSIRLQVDPGGTGTAGGFGSRSQETEVAAASLIHRTRVTHYRWETRTQTDSAHPPSYFLGSLRGRERRENGRNWGKQKQKHTTRIQTVKPFREHRRARHISEISEVSVWYEPPRLSALSDSDLGSVYL